MTKAELVKHLNGLWKTAQTARMALVAGIKGGVSHVRRAQLENDYQTAHRAWWVATRKALKDAEE